MVDITKGTQGHTGRIRAAQAVPEYQGKAVTEPGKPVQGYQAAFESIGKANEMMAELGGQIASNAAQQQAHIMGMEAGQVPGQTLIPEFTQAGKAYNDAYRDQSYKVLSTEGQGYIDKLSFELAKNPNPTPKDLERFETSAQQGIEGLMEYADPSYKQDLKRTLSNKYNSDFQALSGKLVTYNQKVLKQQDAMASETNNSNMYAYTIRGMPEAAESAYQDELKNISSSNDTEPEKLARLNALDYQKKYAEQVKESMDAAKNGDEDAIKWLKDFKDNKPDNITEAQHEQMIPELYKNYSQQRAYKAYDSQIARATANDLILNGQMTVAKLQELQPEMNLNDFIQVQKEFLKKQGRQIENIQFGDYMSENKDDPVAFATSTDKQINGGFAQLVAREGEKSGSKPTFLDEMRLASSIQATIPSVNKKLGAMINSPNPEQAALGSQVYDTMIKRNALSVAGIDSKTAAKAAMIDGQISTGSDPLSAAAYANGKMEGLTSKGIEERKELYKTEIRSKKLNDPIRMKGEAAKAAGFDSAEVPPGFSTDFERSLEKYFVLTEDFEQARELATREIKSNYQEVNINGYSQVMYLPPTLMYGVDELYIKQMLTENSNVLFNTINARFDEVDNDALFNYNFIEERGSAFGASQVEGLSKPKTGPHNRIQRTDKEGNVQEGYLVIKPDDLTAAPDTGQNSSYSLWFQNKDRTKIERITDPNNGGVARFEITKEQLRKRNDEKLQIADLQGAQIRLRKQIMRQIDSAKASPGSLDPLSLEGALQFGEADYE